MTKTCLRCRAEFGCGADSKTEPCWCAALPPIMPVSDAGCLCPPCLKAEVARLLAQETLRAGLCATCSHAKRLSAKGGSTMYLCGLAASDPGYPKFPPLPVRSCVGCAPAAWAPAKG